MNQLKPITMGFGGSASSMNATIKRNMALKGKRKTFFDKELTYHTDGDIQMSERPKCSPATLKRLREKRKSAKAADRREALLAYFIGCVVAIVAFIVLFTNLDFSMVIDWLK
ncbi:MAG: hypothetical protein AAF828_06470 [Bacteroidota bacterium]